jgi:hypothetical protein
MAFFLRDFASYVFPHSSAPFGFASFFFFFVQEWAFRSLFRRHALGRNLCILPDICERAAVLCGGITYRSRGRLLRMCGAGNLGSGNITFFFFFLAKFVVARYEVNVITRALSFRGSLILRAESHSNSGKTFVLQSSSIGPVCLALVPMYNFPDFFYCTMDLKRGEGANLISPCVYHQASSTTRKRGSKFFKSHTPESSVIIHTRDVNSKMIDDR